MMRTKPLELILWEQADEYAQKVVGDFVIKLSKEDIMSNKYKELIRLLGETAFDKKLTELKSKYFVNLDEEL